MHDNRTHPLLAQVPLTVSPFINLPTSVTLPYTYKAMPSALPPSATGISSTNSAEGTSKPRYVVSQSGHAAHPDDIIASCRALQDHIGKLQADAERELRELDERIQARELAEKRRVAPGWLDSDARLLEPERAGGSGQAGMDLLTGSGEMAGEGIGGVSDAMQGLNLSGGQQVSEMAAFNDEGAQLDRAFGSVTIQPK